MSRRNKVNRQTKATGRDGLGQKVSVNVSEQTTIEEAFPDPETLELYKGIDESLVDRIMSFGEREQKHRHRSDIKLINILKSGQYFAVLVTLSFLAGAIYLLKEGLDVAGYVSMVAALAPIIVSILQYRSK